MKFLNKKKKDAEPIIRANGKIVITDFSKLDPKDFPYNDLTDGIEGQLALLSCDGVIFINRTEEGHEYVADIFSILMRESQYNLDQFAKIYKKKFPQISLSNWNEMQGNNEERTQVLAALLCPAEISRRRIEKDYYNKK
ncbi:MAG: hypothetical protein K2N34_01875 [Lachnospiraceae bacterium]|nr:hypothetical protein [Lachnospiraceae bacterium]